MGETAPAGEADDYDAAVEETIALCGGDARAAVKALLIVNDYLERELEETRAAVSKGYARGRGGRNSGGE